MITAQWNVVIQPCVLTSLTPERPERTPARRAQSVRESGNQIWNQPSNKAARFISSDTKALNLELRFSGSFALHSQIRSTMLSSRRSATHTSRKGFDQDNRG